MVMWTLLTWILAPIFAIYFDYTGVAIAYLLISFTSIIPIIMVKNMFFIDIFGSIVKPLAASAIMAGLVFGLSLLLPRNLITLIVLVIVGITVYTAIIFLFAKKNILLTWHSFKNVK